MFVYVLRCENETFYVGKTENLNLRLTQHRNGSASNWTKLHPVIELIEHYESNNEFDEDNLTKKYMAKYGIDNVRGGSYCKVTLTRSQVRCLTAEITTLNNLCYNCNKRGHFTKDCHSRNRQPISSANKKCSRCGRKNHTSEKCYATTAIIPDSFKTADIDLNSNLFELERGKKETDFQKNANYFIGKIWCHNCGKAGTHFPSDCYPLPSRRTSST